MNQNLNNKFVVLQILQTLDIKIGKYYKVERKNRTEYFHLLGVYLDSNNELKFDVNEIVVGETYLHYNEHPFYWQCLGIQSFDAWNYQQNDEDSQFYDIEHPKMYAEYEEYFMHKLHYIFDNAKEITKRSFEVKVKLIKQVQR